MIVDLAGGQKLSFQDRGGSGPAILMLHSFLMDHEMFAPQVAAFGDRYRLIGVNARGHGGTPAGSSFDHWDVARDIIALLDYLKIDKAAIMGTSQGGSIAMRVALLAPGRIGALCLMGTSAAADPPQVVESYLKGVKGWAAHGPDRYVDATAKVSMGDYDSEAIKARWRTVDGEQLVTSMKALVHRDSLLDRLGEIKCPTIVLHGTADPAYSTERAHETVKYLGVPAELILIEGGAHYLSLTDAEEVNAHLDRFLRLNWR